MNTKLNKSDYILLIVYFVVSTAMNAYDYYLEDSNSIEYLVDFFSQIISTFLLIYLFMYWLIPTYIVNKKKYIHFVFLGLLIMFVIGILQYTLGYWSGGNDWNKFPTRMTLFLIGIYNSTEIMGLPFALLLTKKFYESQTQIIDIQKQQKENELKLLRSQLDPHFLFNNLNTLDALIDSNPEKAKEYINRLSLIYRYLIQTKDAEVMELSEELNLAENYLFLIKIRFGSDYDFKITKNSELSNKFIPTGAVQALLENVVKHNKAQNNTKIITSIEVNDDWLIVTNTKSKLTSTQESFGTGLENLKARYQLLSDKNIEINESSLEFEISIPIIKLSQES